MRNSIQLYNDHEDVWDTVDRMHKLLDSTDDHRATFTMSRGAVQEVLWLIRDLEEELDKALETKECQR